MYFLYKELPELDSKEFPNLIYTRDLEDGFLMRMGKDGKRVP